MSVTTPSAEALAERVKRLVAELNAALTDATVAGVVVRVALREAAAKNVGPTIEVELLRRL